MATYSPKYLTKTFLVLKFKFSMQHETFILKQFEGSDFKFHSHSYLSRNIQTRCVTRNNKVTLLHWKYFIFTSLRLLITNLSITFLNSFSLSSTLSTFYPQVYILLDSGMIISVYRKNFNISRTLL